MRGAKAPPTKYFGPQYLEQALFPPFFETVVEDVFELEVVVFAWAEALFASGFDFADPRFGIEREKEEEKHMKKTKITSMEAEYSSASSRLIDQKGLLDPRRIFFCDV
jgi:hypothetical protein